MNVGGIAVSAHPRASNALDSTARIAYNAQQTVEKGIVQPCLRIWRGCASDTAYPFHVVIGGSGVDVKQEFIFEVFRALGD